MKILSDNEIIGLPVYTQSGQFLGKVNSFDVELSSQKVIQYKVKHKGFLEGLFKDQLLINRSQVISLTSEKMVVDDNVFSEEEKERIRIHIRRSVNNEAVMQSRTK